jgi:hypothetical protein
MNFSQRWKNVILFIVVFVLKTERKREIQSTQFVWNKMCRDVKGDSKLKEAFKILHCHLTR